MGTILYTGSGGAGTSGYSGVSGSSGFSGLQGGQGVPGSPGDSGYSGKSGLSGYSGVSGYSGESGASGYSGTLGISGYSGESGVSGYSGASGASSYSGSSGLSGYSGDSGVSGYSGSSGTSGYSGTSGVSGDSGVSGYSGISGYSAYSGASGYSGVSGYSGISGTSAYSGQSGVSGYSGAQGESGPSGPSGLGISGFSGYSGGGGSGSGDSIKKTYTQASHGFAVGDVIYRSSGSWGKAKADAEATAEAIGIVESVNGNDFVVVFKGYISGLSGLTDATVYYLSDSTAGALTSTEPTISKPMLVATGTTTGIVVNYRGLQSGGTGSQIETGMIVPYAGSSAPAGFLLCDGTAVSRTTYSNLYSTIGTTYGAGDTTTTFNTPDLRGRVPVGVGTGTGGGSSGTGLPTGGSALTAVSRGTWKGAETHTLSVAELASHNHTHNIYSALTSAAGGNNYTAAAGSWTFSTSIAINNAGSGSAHNNIQPIMGVNFIIKI